MVGGAGRTALCAVRKPGGADVPSPAAARRQSRGDAMSSAARTARTEHDPAAVVTITAIRATEVNLPLVPPYRWVAGLYHGSTKVVVEPVGVVQRLHGRNG